jgi:serine O-acetyltransferase
VENFCGFQRPEAVALNDQPGIPCAEGRKRVSQGPRANNGTIYMGMPIQAGAWGEDSPDRTYVSSEPGCDAGKIAKQKTHPHGLWTLLYQDYRRYRAAGARNAFSVVALTQGFWASAVFRISHWSQARCRVRGFRAIVKGTCVLMQKFIEIITGICLPGRCNIGPGLYIGHFGGIFVDSEARIGENCNLAQGVTIGKGGRGELHGVPILGDRVHIGANAVILGKIVIGDDAAIGPGAVVMNSVPARGVAMGNPARIVGMSGSFDFVHYDGMGEDPARNPPNQIDRETVRTKER